MKAVSVYGVACVLVLVILAPAVSVLVPGTDPAGVWLAAGIALPLQLAAFWMLVKSRGGPGFVVGWGGGILLRLGAILVVALWVKRTGAVDAATVLLSLIGFVFVLVLLEPLFLRLAD